MLMRRVVAGKVLEIFICPNAGDPMVRVPEVEAMVGAGLMGDRYSVGQGSWNRDEPGERQVTLISSESYYGTVFLWEESRRNIVTEGVELPSLIGVEFEIGGARMLGVKYCDPCPRPGKLSGRKGFKESFRERGGVICNVIETGRVYRGAEIATWKKPK